MAFHKGKKFITRSSLNKWRKILMKSKKPLQPTPYDCCCCCCFQWFKLSSNKIETTKSYNTKNSSDGKVPKDVPKGYMVVYVGENVRRFIVKISLLKQPLFVGLLDMVRDENDDFTTPLKLWIPCDEDLFIHVVRCSSSLGHRRWWVSFFCL